MRYRRRLTSFGEVSNKPARIHIADDGAWGHPDQQIFARCSSQIGAATRLPRFGPEDCLALEPIKGIKSWIDDQDNIAAPSPIAAGWPTEGHVFLAAKTDHTWTPIAAPHLDDCLVQEHSAQSIPRCALKINLEPVGAIVLVIAVQDKRDKITQLRSRSTGWEVQQCSLCLIANHSSHVTTFFDRPAANQAPLNGEERIIVIGSVEFKDRRSI